MEYSVKYEINLRVKGEIGVLAHVYDINCNNTATFLEVISEPSWLSKKLLKETMETRILDARTSLENAVARFIRSKRTEQEIKSLVSEVMYQGKIEGAHLVKDMTVPSRSIGFNTSVLFNDRPSVKPPQ